MKLRWNLVYNDIRKNKIISIVLLLFLLLSATLMAGGLRVAGTMLSATAGLDRIATPPEYLQMHKGDYDAEAVQAFSDTHSYIRDSIVVSMLNIDNANIFYDGGTLENCLMDNGFVTQNTEFDYLLDMNQEIATVQDGEVGVSVYYYEELGIKPGDIITIRDGNYKKDLTVVTLIRDAQMNAPLTSSKRFLISEADQRELSEHTGEWEYSFEYLLEPGTDTAVLEKDYINAGMPSNGVAITGSLLNLMNTLSYGLIVFLLMIVSLLLIFIALLCLSYIIKATLTEEHRAIGTMKAIGFSLRSIEKMYLMKYMLLAITAGAIGYFVAIPFSSLCSQSVILYCGTGTTVWMQWVYPIVGIVLLELLITMRCKKMIRKNLKSTVVELLRGEDYKHNEGHYKLPKKKWKNANAVIAFGELSCKWKEYIVLFLVFVLSTFLILLPINMQTTIQDPSFITYMGIGQCDIRVDMQYSNDNEEKAKFEEQRKLLLTQLEQDKEIDQYAVFQTGYIQVQNTNEWEYLRVSSGDETVFPLAYLEGEAPQEEKDIAISYMEATELNKAVGDTVTIKVAEDTLDYTVSGIYQDVTYGGKTAKAQMMFPDQAIEGYVIYLDVQDGASVSEKATEIRELVSGGRVTPITEFVKQTLGGISGHMGTMIVAATVLSLLLVILISMMFLQLVTAREHSAVAIKKALGFTNRDIRIQFGIRILAIQVVAVILGAILTNTLGEVIFGALVSMAGSARITMLISPIVSYLVCPAAQILVCIVTVVSATRVVKKYHIRDQIME